MELINAASAARHFTYSILKVAIPKEPSLMAPERLRAKSDHIAEELDELIDSEAGIEEQADAFIDIIYIALGGLAEMGLAHKAQDLFEAVHLANMKKVSGVVSKRGAVHDAVKPEGWQAPDLEKIIWPEEFILPVVGTSIKVVAEEPEWPEQVKVDNWFREGQEACLAKPKDTPEATVQSRKELYGTFKGRAVVCDEVMKTLRSHPNWSRKLEPIHRHGLTMLVEKIGRILEGNPNYLDNWHDVGGYGHLVETEIKESGRGI